MWQVIEDIFPLRATIRYRVVMGKYLPVIFANYLREKITKNRWADHNNNNDYSVVIIQSEKLHRYLPLPAKFNDNNSSLSFFITYFHYLELSCDTPTLSTWYDITQSNRVRGNLYVTCRAVELLQF